LTLAPVSAGKHTAAVLNRGGHIGRKMQAGATVLPDILYKSLQSAECLSLAAWTAKPALHLPKTLRKYGKSHSLYQDLYDLQD
jgi:hypothetical protein